MQKSQGSKKSRFNYVFWIAAIIAIVAALGSGASALIDWNQFKPVIEQRASDALGRKVSIGGKIGGMILPITQITAHDVMIANADGGRSAYLLKLESLDILFSPWSLLAGKLDIQQLHLNRPDVQLEKLSDGRGNWEFSPAAAGSDAASGNASAASDALSGIPALRDLKIVDGTIAYRDASGGKPIAIQKFNMAADIDLAARIAKINGDVEYGGKKSALDLSIKPSGDKVAVDLRWDHPDVQLGYQGSVSDILRHRGAALESAGKFDVKLPIVPPLAISGDLASKGNALSIEKIDIDVAGQKIMGDAKAVIDDTPFVDLKLRADAIDLNNLIPAVMALQKQASGAEDKKTVKNAESVPSGLGIKGNLNLAIGKLSFASFAMDNIRLQAATTDGRNVNLQNLSLQSMGDSVVNLDGVFDVAATSFRGRMNARIDNLQKFAQAFAYSDNPWIKSAPSRLEWQSGLNFASKILTLDNYQLTHGDLKSAGKLAYAFDRGDWDWVGNLRHPSIKRLSQKELPVDGKFAVDGDLSGVVGKSGFDFKSLQGKAKIALRDGAVQGADLKAITARLGSLNKLRDFLDLIDKAKQGGTTPYSAITSDWVVVKGVASTQNLLFESEPARATGAGFVDLAAQKLDINTRANFIAFPKVPSVGMRVFGNLQAPQQEFDTAAIAAYFATKTTLKIIDRLTNPDAADDAKKPIGEGPAGKLLKNLFGQ